MREGYLLEDSNIVYVKMGDVFCLVETNDCSMHLGLLTKTCIIRWMIFVYIVRGDTSSRRWFVYEGGGIWPPSNVHRHFLRSLAKRFAIVSIGFTLVSQMWKSSGIPLWSVLASFATISLHPFLPGSVFFGWHNLSPCDYPVYLLN